MENRNNKYRYYFTVNWGLYVKIEIMGHDDSKMIVEWSKSFTKASPPISRWLYVVARHLHLLTVSLTSYIFEFNMYTYNLKRFLSAMERATIRPWLNVCYIWIEIIVETVIWMIILCYFKQTYLISYQMV